jgi:hypothetical protein
VLAAVVALNLLLAFESFDAPLDPSRWYLGTSAAPKKGRLLLPKDGFIAAKQLPPKGVLRLEIRFRHRGGDLQLTVHDRREPFSAAIGKALRVRASKAKGQRSAAKTGADRVLVISPTGARIDGEALAWAEPIVGSFRLCAIGGAIELDEVRVTPSPSGRVPPSRLERETLYYTNTPERFTEGTVRFRRVTVTLWDVPVALLLARGKRTRNESLAGLCRLVQITDGSAVAAAASGSARAMQDWKDEQKNLSADEYRKFLAGEYALFELLQQAQRAMNATIPNRRDLEPLIALAAIRHANSARAALALAGSQGGVEALRLMRAELPQNSTARVSSDQIRAAAGRAARKVLGKPPAAWKGFRFDPEERFAALAEARGHLR